MMERQWMRVLKQTVRSAVVVAVSAKCMIPLGAK